MTKPNVLLLSTYPYKIPRHGGQLRLANIAKAFADNGWDVNSIAIYEPESYAEHHTLPDDVPFGMESSFRRYQGTLPIPMITDLLSGPFAASDDGAFPQIRKKLPERIDAIHVEQPWLWPLAQRIKSMSQHQDCILIYGSANIEAPLKRDIFQSYDVKADSVLAEIESLEITAAREADIALAVTQADLQQLVQWGAKRPLLAANGISHWEASEESIASWKTQLPEAPWILYVASAHPPNFTGFIKCIGDSLACIPPDSRLVVAGSVSEHIYRELVNTRWHSLNMSRLQLLHVLPEEDLAAVKTLAHAFLLPIPHGGGSNIKTAEAIYSGKHVIGTETAFRGFEDYLDLPQISPAQSPQAFQRLMRETLGGEPTGTSEIGNGKRSGLLWSATLAPIPLEARRLISGGSGA
jgi:glycosyltransferase involved in cell wall biosynthesis